MAATHPDAGRARASVRGRRRVRARAVPARTAPICSCANGRRGRRTTDDAPPLAAARAPATPARPPNPGGAFRGRAPATHICCRRPPAARPPTLMHSSRAPAPTTHEHRRPAGVALFIYLSGQAPSGQVNNDDNNNDNLFTPRHCQAPATPEAKERERDVRCAPRCALRAPTVGRPAGTGRPRLLAKVPDEKNWLARSRGATILKLTDPNGSGAQLNLPTGARVLGPGLGPRVVSSSL